MKNNNKIKLIVNSFLAYILEDDWSILNYGSLKHLVHNADYGLIPDSIIANNEEVYNNVEWERIGRMKLLRIISRNPSIIDSIDLDDYNFTIEESKYLLKAYPAMLDKLKIDLKNINKKEAYILLTLGVEEFLPKVEIEKYKFTSKESYEILKASQFDRYVFDKIRIEFLKDYHIADIIKYTGQKYIEELNFQKLTQKKWCEILEIHPNLLNYCELNKFKTGDIFNTVKLVSLYDDLNLSYLIKERKNYKDELSALGWEKLIISKPDDFIDECVCWKLNDNNWNKIISHHPKLIAYKT